MVCIFILVKILSKFGLFFPVTLYHSLAPPLSQFTSSKVPRFLGLKPGRQLYYILAQIMLRDPCITDLYQIGPDSDSTVVIETQDGEVMQRIWTPLSKMSARRGEKGETVESNFQCLFIRR